MSLKIKDILKLPIGAAVTLFALVNKKETKTKANGDKYLVLTVQDNTGTFDFPLWNDYIGNNELIEVDKVAYITGKASLYNDAFQLKDTTIAMQTEQTSINYDDFVPAYEIPERVFTYFDDVVSKLECKYKYLIEGLTGWNGYDNKLWKEFIISTSAVKHHGNKRGGHFLHVVGVLQNMEAIIKTYTVNPLFYDASKVLNADRLRCLAIVHDVAKMYEYEYKTSIKYKEGKRFDHTVDGLYYIKKVNAERGDLLNEKELEDFCYSILSHHGQWGKYPPETLEDWLLHICDLTDARIIGEVEKSNK